MMFNKTIFKILEMVVAVICSIVLAYLSSKNGNSNVISDAFVGFMLPIVFCLPFQISGKSVEKTHKLEDALKRLEETNKATYELYFTEVTELTKSIISSCETLLYKCSYKPNMVLYKAVCAKLMSYFAGESEHDYFYATAECSRNSINWFFDKFNLAGEFLPLLNEKCQSKKITDFRRLFIYEEDDLKNPVFWFLSFLHYNVVKNCSIDYCTFNFKFIRRNSFKNIVAGQYISDEMGVWGSHCVFIQKNDTSPKGYSFNTEQISTYKKIFDDLWNNTNSKSFEEIKQNFNSFDSLDANDDFEKAILNILKENNRCDIIQNIKNENLSLLNIKEIQDWVQGLFPLSTALGNGAGT